MPRPPKLPLEGINAEGQVVHPAVHNFGAVLRAFREGYASRFAGPVRLKLSSTSFLAALNKYEGVMCGSASFSAIELARSLPENARHFLGAVACALELNSGEASLMFGSFTYDSVTRTVGEDLAHVVFERLVGSDEAFMRDMAAVAAGQRLPESTDADFVATYNTLIDEMQLTPSPVTTS